MEHIVQFGINIDDDAIRKTIERNIQRKVEEQILEDVRTRITGNSNYNQWTYKSRLDELIMDATTKFLEDNKVEIIEKTSDKLAERLSRAKAAKEMMEVTIAQVFNQSK